PLSEFSTLSLHDALPILFLILIVWRKRLVRRRRRKSESMAAASARAWTSAKLIYRNFEIPFGVFLGAAAMFAAFWGEPLLRWYLDRKSTRLNSSHDQISY